MGGYATHVNRFLSLTLSLVMTVTSPASFLALRLGSRALFRPFPLVRSPCSALSFTRLVAGDDQHMSRSWDRACPVETMGSPYASSKMSRMLGSGGLGSEGGVETGGGSVVAASDSCATVGSIVCRGSGGPGCVIYRYGRLFLNVLLLCRLLRGVFLFFVQQLSRFELLT